MKITLIAIALLLLLSFGFADTPEEALEKYYTAAEAENLDQYFSVVSTRQMTEEDLAFEKRVVELTWNSVEGQSHKIEGLQTIVDGEGKTALMQFNLTASYKNSKTGETTSLESIPFLALALKEGVWRIAFSMPLAEYIQLRKDSSQLQAIEKEIEGLAENTGEEKALLLIDGEKFDPDKPDEDGTLTDIQKELLAIIDTAIMVVSALIAIVILLIVWTLVKGRKAGPKVTAKPETVAKKPVEPAKKQEPAKPQEQAKPKPGRSDAMKILRQRLAKGEISKEKFKGLKKELGD